MPSQNITKSTILTILSQVPAHLFGLLAGVFITRILGAEGKGLYALFNTNMTFFCTIFGFSIINSIVYFTANKKISESRLTTIISILLAVTTVLSVIALIIWINSDYIQLFLPVHHITVNLLIVFIVTILISQINAAFTAYFQGLRDFKIVNKILIINGVYCLAIYGVAYFLHRKDYYHFGLSEVIFLSIIVLLMNTIHWCVYYFKNRKISFAGSSELKADFKQFFEFTGLNHLSLVLQFLNHRLILWLIVVYLDNWELGIYSLSMGLGQLLFLFSNPLTLVLESFLSADKVENRGKVFSRFSRIQFTVVLLVCILAASLGPSVLPLIYGKEFTESAEILNVLLIGVIFACQSSIISSLLLANNQLKYNIVASLIGIITTVGLAPYFFGEYKMMGAAIAQNIAYFAVFVYLLIIIRKQLNVDTNLFIITRSDIQFIKRQFAKTKSTKEMDDAN